MFPSFGVHPLLLVILVVLAGFIVGIAFAVGWGFRKGWDRAGSRSQEDSPVDGP